MNFLLFTAVSIVPGTEAVFPKYSLNTELKGKHKLEIKVLHVHHLIPANQEGKSISFPILSKEKPRVEKESNLPNGRPRSAFHTKASMVNL